MKTLGNIIWLIFGGLFSAIGWFFVGVLFCITIIGIPIGKQMFKFAKLMLMPFGKEAIVDFNKHPIANVIWLIISGLSMAVSYFFIGVLFCITIIGIPFGKQWFKLAKLALFPFGAVIQPIVKAKK